MAKSGYRIGVVGASSLAGKELSDALSESGFAGAEVILLDDESVSGQLAVTGDEVAFIQRLGESSFDGMDFAFFAGTAEATKKHWQSARRAGASIIDMTYALEEERDVLVRAPWVANSMDGGEAATGKVPDLKTRAVVAAHPAAVMLALVGARLHGAAPVSGMAATLMVPASEYGREAMDELHKQTVSLLSFQSLPKEQYDTQVSFNVASELGTEAKMNLATTAEQVRRHYGLLSNGRLPRLSLQVVHAPVFHGYVASVMVEFAQDTVLERVEAALAREHIEVTTEGEDPPNNVNAAGREGTLAGVRADVGDGAPTGDSTKRFWLLLAADNLKLGADNAISCAGELRRLRPLGKVQ